METFRYYRLNTVPFCAKPNNTILKFSIATLRAANSSTGTPKTRSFDELKLKKISELELLKHAEMG